jgi:hypothetical protein
MVYNFISPCISVLSAVKQKTVEITFNRRDHGGHRDTRRTFVYTIFILITPLIDHVIFYTVLNAIP